MRIMHTGNADSKTDRQTERRTDRQTDALTATACTWWELGDGSAFYVNGESAGLRPTPNAGAPHGALPVFNVHFYI